MVGALIARLSTRTRLRRRTNHPSCGACVALAAVALVLGCHEGTPSLHDAGHDAQRDTGNDSGPAFAGLTVLTTSSTASVIDSFFTYLPEANASVQTVADPVGGLAGDAGASVRVAVVTDLSCGECYKVEARSGGYVAHGGNALGAQYALASALEQLGFRFFHPWVTHVPKHRTLALEPSTLGITVTPAMTLRGLHLHTLHPIEGYFTFWASRPTNGGADAGDDSGAPTGLAGAERIVDWAVKNGSNYVQWAALNDIVGLDTQDFGTWHAHTRSIIDYAHARGIKVGIGTELFGSSNLQLSFDLLDNQDDPSAEADVDSRLHLLLDDLPWDVVNISFGEFSGTDANVFLTSLDLAYQELQKIAPGTEMAATIHVGSGSSLDVTYNGQTLLYYFLVKYANPAIVPWIHTVMYFDMFENTDGAYGLSNFDDHRAYLEDRLEAGAPVGYFPESAYWVAFDNAVPTYLPVYMRSRWLDITSIAADVHTKGFSPLEQHVLFTTGWEWGYWQNDYATLRATVAPPAAWTDPVNEMFLPWGAKGAALASKIGALGDLQNQYLIGQSLVGYFSAQDALIDFAAPTIVSQPVPVSFEQLASMSPSDQATFATQVLAPLAAFAAKTASLDEAVHAIGLDDSDPFLSETIDGFDVDTARATFVNALYQAVASYRATGGDGGWLARADAAFVQAQTVIARRTKALHYPSPQQITGASVVNSTQYQAGYLAQAVNLCYWTRETMQARTVIGVDASTIPGCVPPLGSL